MKGAICAEICRFVRDEAVNFCPENGKPYFDAPLIGFVAAHDPLFTDSMRTGSANGGRKYLPPKTVI
jgi:hypothetical protein